MNFMLTFDLDIDRGRLRHYVLGDQLHEAGCWSSGTLFSLLETYCRILRAEIEGAMLIAEF